MSCATTLPPSSHIFSRLMRAARIRRWQGGEGPKAPFARGYAGLGAQSRGTCREREDFEGIKTLLRRANEWFPRLRHLWLDAGYRGEDKGADWVRKTLGWSVDVVERPKKPAPEKVLMAWALGSGPKRGWP